MIRQQLEVQDESLLSEEARARLLKRRLSKPKAFQKVPDYPKYVFNATCSGVPQHILVGQRLEFDITIEPVSTSCTTDVEPDVSLDSCTMTLIAQTSGPHPSHIEVLRQRQNTQRPAGPFSKEQGYTKTVDLGVLGHVPSTFNFHDVSQSYKLRLEIQFHAANHTVVMRRETPVVIHQFSDSPRTSSENDGLPTYEEATAGSSRSRGSSNSSTQRGRTSPLRPR